MSKFKDSVKEKLGIKKEPEAAHGIYKYFEWVKKNHEKMSFAIEEGQGEYEKVLEAVFKEDVGGSIRLFFAVVSNIAKITAKHKQAAIIAASVINRVGMKNIINTKQIRKSQEYYSREIQSLFVKAGVDHNARFDSFIEAIVHPKKK